GEGWLAGHPMREPITERYLKHQGRLVRDALARLVEDEDPDAATETANANEQALEERVSLHTQRLTAVADELKRSGAKRVLDLGCGEGKLIRRLLDDAQFETILGVDASCRALDIVADRLSRAPPAKRARVQ